MATPETRSNQQTQGRATDPPAPILVPPSTVIAHSATIVSALEALPEVAQRRILEAVRVSLGLQPRNDQQPKTNK
jgi:hypothetical protein